MYKRQSRGYAEDPERTANMLVDMFRDLIYGEGVFYKAPKLDEQTVRDIAVSTMPEADVDREYVVRLVMANYAKLLK